MARITPTDRSQQLITAAAAVFVQSGYRHTQMDDIAAALGVSKGTVYRSVDSKEALLAAVLTHADAPEELTNDTPLDGYTLTEVSSSLADRLTRVVAGLELATASRATSRTAFGHDLERIASDVFDMMAAHRVRIMVLDRCAPELPALAGDWYAVGRYSLVDVWASYLDMNATHIADDVDHDVLARTIVELLTLWAVKMLWDPNPRPYPADMTDHCGAMVRRLAIGGVS